MHTSVMIHYNQQHLYPLLFNNKQELEMWIQTGAYQKTDSRTYSLLHNTWVFICFHTYLYTMKLTICLL